MRGPVIRPCHPPRRPIPHPICKGADVHVRTGNGHTSLKSSCWHSRRLTQCHPIVQVLVEASCDPFALSNANKQPIRIHASRAA